jgi:PleD family two-component response regulator
MLPALEKLQEAIRERLRSPDGVVTVSMGAAAFTASDDPREWLSRADRALYAAKAAGRDRICLDHG